MFNNKVYHRIDSLSGSVATLRAEGVSYNEIAEIESRAGTSLAQVIKLDGPNVTLQIFAGARGVDTAARVRFLGETMRVPFGEELLGRAFTGAGKPRDGGAPRHRGRSRQRGLIPSGWKAPGKPGCAPR